MQGNKTIFTRQFQGQNERVEWIRQADNVWIVVNGKEAILHPEDWRQAWADLEARGFVEVFPTDRRKLKAEKLRVEALIREAFQGVTLGDGVGLNEAEGLDDYASKSELESLRARDEKLDWSAISVADLDLNMSSPCFFDANGMRFHLPAYMIAELQDQLHRVYIFFRLTSNLEFMTSQFATLSPIQREAVRAFLRLRLSDHAENFDHPEIEAALHDYWNDPPIE